MKKAFLIIVVLIITGTAFFAGRWYGPVHPDGSDSQGDREILYYVDPMTPGFRSDEPGIAPCGMPLEPVYADADEGSGDSTSPPPNAVRVNPARQQLIGVRVAPVEIKPMTYTLRLYGKVVPDETLIYRLNASTDSWVRELSDVTTGSIVDNGQILAEVLAPAFYNAQVTFLVAMDNIDRINRELSGQTRHNQADIADNRIRVAVQALQNLGITDQQVEELANTREAQPYFQVRAPTRGVVLERNLTLSQWFKAGEKFFTIADIGKVWVYADVYEDEARHLKPGMKMKVRHKQMGRTFDATVSRVLPLFDQVSKTLKIRLDIQNPHYDLRPDMFIDVEIPITMPPSLHVPADAVIDSGTKVIVYVDMGSGYFEPRPVSTGWRLGRQVQITNGLMPGERVVVAGNFLIDSESRMRIAAAGSEMEMARDPVCGMYVEVGNAVSLGRTATHAGKTWYFCMDECRDDFEKTPEKYLSKDQTGDMKHHTDMPGLEKSWLEALNQARTGKGTKKTDVGQGKGKGDIFGPALTSRGVVDWDGPKPRGEDSNRDWTGWGKFPGSKYLGMPQETGGKTESNQDQSSASSPSPGHDAKKNNEHHKMPAPDQSPAQTPAPAQQ